MLGLIINVFRSKPKLAQSGNPPFLRPSYHRQDPETSSAEDSSLHALPHHPGHTKVSEETFFTPLLEAAMARNSEKLHARSPPAAYCPIRRLHKTSNLRLPQLER